ncbi:hypothetical protein HPP92_012532 [Vanilla planifolia]|uniref:Uncharacterized protein n=1 Tax=Vanilla planifolia TaxID=51239 RepID=A0A835R0L8_VANPL|nr:hypothetical protein HPP92_012532 [Vanilla planifolia]
MSHKFQNKRGCNLNNKSQITMRFKLTIHSNNDKNCARTSKGTNPVVRRCIGAAKERWEGAAERLSGVVDGLQPGGVPLGPHWSRRGGVAGAKVWLECTCGTPWPMTDAWDLIG